MLQLDNPVVKEVRAGIDWLTATCADPEERERFWHHGILAVRAEELKGNQIRDYTWKGYRMYQAGSAAVGDRGDTTIVRLSGDVAGADWTRVVGRCTNVSRLDLAVTVRFDRAHPAVAAQGYSAAAGHKPVNGRPPVVSQVLDTEGGHTVYVGRRSSDVMLRLYDKGVESGSDPAGYLWRFEVELKRAVALQTARALSVRPLPGQAVANAVRRAYQLRGIIVPWRSESTFEIERGSTPSDWSRRLAWLEKAVSPTLREARSRGQLAEAAEALGLYELLPELERLPIQPPEEVEDVDVHG